MPWINVLQQSIVNKRFFFSIYLKNVLKTVFYYTCFKYILMMPWYLICSHIKSRELRPPPQKKTTTTIIFGQPSMSLFVKRSAWLCNICVYLDYDILIMTTFATMIKHLLIHDTKTGKLKEAFIPRPLPPIPRPKVCSYADEGKHLLECNINQYSGLETNTIVLVKIKNHWFWQWYFNNHFSLREGALLEFFMRMIECRSSSKRNKLY